VDRWHNRAAVLSAIERHAPAGALLWQYVPHMYGRGGVNLGIPRVLRNLRRCGRRQVVLVHEIAAPLSVWPHRCAYALAQRLMWRGVWKHADALGISTGGWLEKLQKIHPGDPRLFLAPSPSNLDVQPVESGHAERWRARHGLQSARYVLGYFGSIGSGKQFEWVLTAWREARRRETRTGMVVIGAKPDVAGDEARLFRALGYLQPSAASEALQALDLLVLPFLDGASERRSSFMAGLAHGIPVLTTFGPATGRDLRGGGFCRGVSGGHASFVAEAMAWLGDEPSRLETGRRAREVYQSRYDWPCLAAILAGRLTGGPG
jgi:glycosyltransferase involved in cell wall biosynthesis